MPSISWEKLRTNSWLHIFLLFLAIVICYFSLWNAYFSTWDDFWLTGEVRSRATISEAAAGLDNGVRFLNYAMVWVKTRLFDLNASAYFWASLIQHMTVSVIIYKFIDFVSRNRLLAFLTALVFATKFSFWEVVTGVSASDYSFWAIFWTLTVSLFAVYLSKRALPWYFASLACCAVLAFAHDFSLNIPLILIAYHLTLGRGNRPLRSLGWADLRLHLPYWFFWGIHVALQFSFVFGGSSEAIYSPNEYTPGLHMIGNLWYLTGLFIPNIPLWPALIENFGMGIVNAVQIFSAVLGLALHGTALYLLWKGTALTRFAVALMYLPFLQYTLWQGGYTGAPRYLYLASIGFSILAATLILHLYDYVQKRRGVSARPIVFALVGVYLLANVAVIQVWVQRHVANSAFRSAFVARLASDFQTVGADARIYIEVPEEKYYDLADACHLVLAQSPRCESFLVGARTLDEVTEAADAAGDIYWLQATDEGLVQIYPPAAASS